jgi:hypothetical protein
LLTRESDDLLVLEKDLNNAHFYTLSMARKSSWAEVGRILGAISGILLIVSGILQLIGGILGDNVWAVVNFAGWLNDLGGVITGVIYAIIIIVLGVLILLLSIGRFGLNYVLIGILLIIFAIIAGGLPALLALIGGICYIVAGA